jgi:D-galactarolactone cycloisomerase
MKITDVKVSLLQIPYPVPFRSAWAQDIEVRTRPITLVQVYTDLGIVGIGASGQDEWYSIEHEVKPYLIGKDPLRIEEHIRVIRRVSAWPVDMALCDIIGKAAGKPLHQLWGVYQEKIPAYASIVAGKSPEARAEDALRYLEQGFKAIKLRIHHEKFADDIRMVEVVRRAVGDRMEIMVDANQAGVMLQQPTGVVWNLERAKATALELENYNTYWLEEPLPRHQLEDLAILCDAVDIFIAGGEGDVGIHTFRRILDLGSYDIVQPDCVMSEGLSQMRKIAAMTEMRDRLFIPHHGNTGIGLAAHMQLCATLPHCPWVEFIIDPPYRTVETYQQLWGVITDPLVPDAEGNIAVPQKPGLGVDIDEEVLAKYRVGP